MLNPKSLILYGFILVAIAFVYRYQHPTQTVQEGLKSAEPATAAHPESGPKTPEATTLTVRRFDPSKKYVLMSAGSIRDIHPAELDDPIRVQALEKVGKIREAGDSAQGRPATIASEALDKIKKQLPPGAALVGGDDIAEQIHQTQKATNDRARMVKELDNATNP